MERFNWRWAESGAEHGDLRNRFAEARIDGETRALWEALLDRLNQPNADLFEIEDQFFADADTISESWRARADCVFISHQRADADLGERVACLADHRGVDCWLDIHDPTLIRLGSASISPLVRSLLIAAVVEIALLSSDSCDRSAHAKQSRFAMGSLRTCAGQSPEDQVEERSRVVQAAAATPAGLSLDPRRLRAACRDDLRRSRSVRVASRRRNRARRSLRYAQHDAAEIISR